MIFGNDTVLANVGQRVAAYCPDKRWPNLWTAEVPIGCGYCERRFCFGGAVLTVTSPFSALMWSGMRLVLRWWTAPAGFSVDGNGVISADSDIVSGLIEGRNND